MKTCIFICLFLALMCANYTPHQYLIFTTSYSQECDPTMSEGCYPSEPGKNGYKGTGMTYEEYLEELRNSQRGGNPIENGKNTGGNKKVDEQSEKLRICVAEASEYGTTCRNGHHTMFIMVSAACTSLANIKLITLCTGLASDKLIREQKQCTKDAEMKSKVCTIRHGG